MPETILHCPLCNSSQSTLFDQRQFAGLSITNRLCPNCGLVYQSPRLSETELKTFYQAEYRRLYQGSEGPDAKDLAVQSGRAAALLAFARTNIHQVSWHLDVGCSAGLLLQAFQDAYGCQPVGIEPGNAYRAYACEHGLTVYSSLDELPATETAPMPGGRFDLISLAHVLEHIPDPVGYLSRLCRDWLAENGWLLVEVPNLYCHDCFEIAHLMSFSARTLSQSLLQAGFTPVTYHLHGAPRSRLLPLYLTILARAVSGGSSTPPEGSENGKIAPAIQPEKWVPLKRRYGLLHRRLLTRLFPKQAWLAQSTAQKVGAEHQAGR